MIVNERDIRVYLAKKAHYVQSYNHLLELLLLPIIKNNPSFFEKIVNSEDISSKNLRRRFKKASQPWLKFNPNNNELDKLTETALAWVSSCINDLGADYSGVIRLAVMDEVSKVSKFKNVMQRMKHPILSQDILCALWSERLISEEEAKGHIAHEAALKARTHLVRIKTPIGLKNAGKNANNCLGYNNFPNGMEPHKKRILRPSEWLYFSIRDPDNKSIATIMIDVRHGYIAVEGNAQKSVPDHCDHLVFSAIDAIEEKYPHAAANYNGHTLRYYTWKKYRTEDNFPEVGTNSQAPYSRDDIGTMPVRPYGPFIPSS